MKVSNTLFVLLALFALATMIRDQNDILDVVAEEDEGIIMTEQEWAKLEFAQSCPRQFDAQYCAPYREMYTAEELSMDISSAQIVNDGSLMN